MTARKYRVYIYWSEEDEAFLAEVPELPGCMTHGDTVAGAATNAEEAIEGWIEAAGVLEREVPEPIVEKQYSGKFVTRIPRDLHGQLASEAQRQGVSLNQYVATALAEATARDRVRDLADELQELAQQWRRTLDELTPAAPREET